MTPRARRYHRQALRRAARARAKHRRVEDSIDRLVGGRFLWIRVYDSSAAPWVLLAESKSPVVNGSFVVPMGKVTMDVVGTGHATKGTLETQQGEALAQFDIDSPPLTTGCVFELQLFANMQSFPVMR